MADISVAIIGVSYEFPGHPDWDSLTALLRSGTDRVGRMPEDRAAETGLEPDSDGQPGAWLNHITGFDARYFGISRADAELIDPRQRRMLHLAVGALGDAGYAPAELRGSDTAVVVAAYGGTEPTLRELLPDDLAAQGPAVIGSMPAYSAGRIAYHLDLRGAATVVDTACSSFLVALHEARWKVARGESSLALVGGFELILGPPPRRPENGDGLGVLSPSGRCRPFDAEADGTTFGEGGGFVVLKRLSDARRDGDTVYAVLRGSAVNQDAGRANGLTSPSPTGQAEVIAKAWRDAAVGPADIGYLEAHGTATRIGDPIELQGIGQAVARWPGYTGQIPISSVKGNFGHLDCMAGFAGLLRVLAQFRDGRLFPTAHFQQANPLADLASGPVRVLGEVQDWPGGTPRIAGISSFGLSGTNAHVVVEEGPRPVPPSSPDRPATIMISARDRAGLRDLVGRLRSAIAEPGGAGIGDLARQLAIGREHFAHRAAWVVRDRAALSRELAGELDETVVATPPPVVLALGGEHTPPGVETLLGLARDYRGFADVTTAASAIKPAESWSMTERAAIHSAGLRSVLADLRIVPVLVLAHASGAAGVAFAEGGRDLTVTPNAAPPDGTKLRAALASVPDEAIVLDLAPGSELSIALSGHYPAANVRPAGTPAELLRVLYLLGFTPDWRSTLPSPRIRSRLPVAPLLDEHCWPLETTRPDTTPTPELSVAEQVLEFVRSVLKEPDTTLDDDFFAIGGDSLNGTRLVNRINEHFGTDIAVLDLFDHSDIGGIAEAVEEELPEPSPAPSIPAAEPAASGPLSGQQLSIWAAGQLDPESNAYNVPEILLFDGVVEAGLIRERLAALTRRHPMLRAVLRDTESGPRQVVEADRTVELEEIRLDLSHRPYAVARAELEAGLAGLVRPPLSPYDRPVRAQLVRIRFADTERDALTLTVHHLFCDGWSWRILLPELIRGPSGDAPARTYFDLVREQSETLAGERGRRLTRFWTDYLGGAPEAPLPTTHREQVIMPGSGGVLPLELDAVLFDGLKELARRERATVNMVLLAAWSVLLSKITGVPDQSVAIPVNGRGQQDEEVVGCFVNTVAIRSKPSPDTGFTDYLAEIRGSQLAALAHADLPTDRIVRLAHPRGSAMLATTNFAYHAGVERIAESFGDGGPGVELLDVDPSAPAFPISVSMLEYGAELRGRVKYAADLFDRETVEGWLTDFEALLRRLTENGEKESLQELTGAAPAGVALPDFRF
ncbi:condensation domain-containing protein [Amycolatopsis sp. NPDC057786]|uniref:condensation domain-containing protein n=1 Tax=Amycolatopsis sp. NPDC057786 TaxID=3346250 RepID=UPI00366CA16B